MEKNKMPYALNESIEQLIDELEARCRDAEDKTDKWVLANKYNSLKYLYQLYKNTYKTINELKNQNDL
jgi:hypothetical protein